MLGQERLEAQSVPADTGARVESRFTAHELKDKMNIYPANSHRRIKKYTTKQEAIKNNYEKYVLDEHVEIKETIKTQKITKYSKKEKHESQKKKKELWKT